MSRRLILLAFFTYILVAFCGVLWVVLPESWRVLPVLILALGVLWLAGSFTLPGHVRSHVEDREIEHRRDAA